jgi:hypothetical protein
MIYPLISWRVAVPAFTIDVTVGTGVAQTLTIQAGDYWGWRSTGAENVSGTRLAASDSLADVLADALKTHTSIGALGASGRYGNLSGLGVGYHIAFASVFQSVAITATSDPAALALFGITSLPFTLQTGGFPPVFQSVTTRTAGVWRPYNVDGGRCEPVFEAVGSGAWSPYNPAINDRVLVSSTLGWVATWEFVEASDITREVNGLADYLPLAGRLAGDDNGTLDDLIYAAASGGELLLALRPIGTAAVDYRACIIPQASSLRRDSFTSEATTGGRRYNVTLPLLETRVITL